MPTALTLAALVGIAWWGYANEWRLPDLAAHAGEEGDDEKGGLTRVVPDPSVPTSADPAARSSHLLRIEFPSEDAVRKTGLIPKPVETRKMTDYVVANGVLAFDQTHYAQLAPRVPGTVWHVAKNVGQAVARGELLALVEAAEVGKAKGEFLQSLVQAELERADGAAPAGQSGIGSRAPGARGGGRLPRGCASACSAISKPWRTSAWP